MFMFFRWVALNQVPFFTALRASSGIQNFLPAPTRYPGRLPLSMAVATACRPMPVSFIMSWIVAILKHHVVCVVRCRCGVHQIRTKVTGAWLIMRVLPVHIHHWHPSAVIAAMAGNKTCSSTLFTGNSVNDPGDLVNKGNAATVTALAWTHGTHGELSLNKTSTGKRKNVAIRSASSCPIVRSPRITSVRNVPLRPISRAITDFLIPWRSITRPSCVAVYRRCITSCLYLVENILHIPATCVKHSNTSNRKESL